MVRYIEIEALLNNDRGFKIVSQVVCVSRSQTKNQCAPVAPLGTVDADDKNQPK